MKKEIGSHDNITDVGATRLAEALVRYNQDVIIVQDKDSTIRYISPSVKNIFGYVPEGLIGKSLFDYIHPDDLSRARMALTESIENSGKVYKLNYRVKDNNGDWRFTEAIGSSHFDDPAIAGFVINARDITERERARVELEDANRKFLQISDNIEEGFFLSSRDYKVLYANPAFGKIWGVPVDVIMKNPKSWSDYVLLEDRDRLFALSEENLSKGRDSSYQYRISRPDGGLRWVNANVTIIKDKGDIIGFAGIVSDITKSKQEEERSKELDLLKNKFIQIVSHQMRTPLSAIRWNAENLLGGDMGGKMSKEHEDVVRVIYNSDISILDRLDDLILSLDIEKRAIRLEKEKTFIRSFVDSIIIEYASMINLKKIKINFSTPDIKYLVDIDPVRLKSALKKIIDNAIRYSKDGGEVKIVLDAKDKEVYLTVSDNGIGIPASEQDDVFKKFFRASNATLSSPDASGLGLFIAKNIIELHGGKIWCDSREGVGSNFYISLPIAD